MGLCDYKCFRKCSLQHWISNFWLWEIWLLTTVWKFGGNDSISKYIRAIPGSGRVKKPVIEHINRNMLCQKLVRCLQDQKICIMFPAAPHPLQHKGESVWENLDIRYGVRDHLRVIFWESSQWLTHLVSLYIVSSSHFC